MQASARRLVAIVVGVLLALSSAGLLAPAMASPERAAKDLDCGDFGSQASAQDYFLSIGGPSSDPDYLDADGDGIACESLPCPCSYATGGGGGGGTTTPPPAPTTVRTKARIISVIDGDTVLVRAGGVKRRVRLIGVAAPSVSPRQCGGPASARSARTMLPRGTRVTLVSDPTQPRKDGSGRLLRYVIKGSSDIGAVQILRGWAKVQATRKPFKRVTRYRTAQSSAQAAVRGIWRAC